MRYCFVALVSSFLLGAPVVAQDSRPPAALPFLAQTELSLGTARGGAFAGMRFTASQRKGDQGYFLDYGSLQPGAFTLGSGIASRQISFLGVGVQAHRRTGRSFATLGAGIYRADYEQPFFDSSPNRILGSALGAGLRYGVGYQAQQLSFQLSLTHLPRLRQTDALNRAVLGVDLGYRF